MSDLSITPANVVFSANAKFTDGIAGETITVGQPLYFNSVDKRLYKADANASIATADAVGVAAVGAAAGQPMRYCYEDPDYTPGATLTAALIYILSGTVGAIAPAADLTAMYTCVLFVAKSTTKANLRLVKQTSVLAA